MSDNISIKSFEDLDEFLKKMKKGHTENRLKIVAQIKEEGETKELLDKKISIENAGKKSNLGIAFINNEIGIGELPEDVIKLMFKILFL